jgi:hypothetical protein
MGSPGRKPRNFIYTQINKKNDLNEGVNVRGGLLRIFMTPQLFIDTNYNYYDYEWQRRTHTRLMSCVIIIMFYEAGSQNIMSGVIR